MRSWFFSLTSIALISIGILLVIFTNIDPSGGSQIAFFGFFFSAFCALFSIFTILYSLISMQRHVAINNATKSRILRRSLILSIIIIGLVLFSALKVLNFLSALNFILAAILLEVFFVSRTKEKVL